MNFSINGIARAMLVFSVLTVSAIAGLAQTSDGALNKDGVKRTIAFMKQTNSSDQEIAGVISRTGVDFKPSAADERELRQAGASDAVINAVRGSYQGSAQPDNQPQETNPRPEDKASKEDAAPKENKTPKNTASENATRRENNNRRRNESQQARQQSNQNTEDEQTQPTTKAANDPERPNQEQTTQLAAAPNRQQNSAGLTADQKLLLFKVGDSVDVDITQMMPPNKKWYKATVVKVNTNALGDIIDYDVQMDTVDGSEVIRDHIPRRMNWIRAASGAEAAQANQTNQPSNRDTLGQINRNQDQENRAPSRRDNGGPDGLTFQVGDRVEVDVTQMMPPNKKWYKATVVKVNTNSLGDVLDYDVKLNTVDGSEVTRDHIPKRPNWIRPLQ